MRRPGSIRSRVVVASPVLAALFLLAACESTPPRGPGAIQIQSTVTNQEFSFFDYGIAIDGGAPYEAFSSVTKNILAKGLAHGPHTVSLENLPAQCSAGTAGPERTVTLQGDDTVGVVFSIVCARTSGDLTITVTTTGPDPDPDGYLVTIDGFTAAFVGANSSTTLNFLVPDLYTVGLADMASNCTYGGAQNVSVAAGSKPTVSFAVTCSPLAHIRVVASTTGPEPDPDGYLLVAAGDTMLVAGDETTVVPVSAGTVSYAVSDLQPNCAFGGPSSGEATLAGGDTLTLTLTATCTDLPAGTAALEYDEPVGDTLANTGGPRAHDIRAVATRYAPGWLIASMKFVHPVAPISDELPNSVGGWLEIDADESAATGISPNSNFFGASASLGIDYTVVVFYTDGSLTLLFDEQHQTIVGIIPIRFDGDSIRIYFPLEKMQNDDGNVSMVMLYGTADRPTDFAPNTGELVSHLPEGMIAGATPGRRSTPRMRLFMTPEIQAMMRAAGTWKPRR